EVLGACALPYPLEALRGGKSMRTLNKTVNVRTYASATVMKLLAARPLEARGSDSRPRASALAWSALALAVGFAVAASAFAQDGDRMPVPAEQTAAAAKDPSWQAPRLSWGDPDLQGTFTSRDMTGIPMERPEQFGDRRRLTPEEFQARGTSGPAGLAAIAAGQGNDGSRLELSALDSAETGTRTFGYTSYIIEPENGRMPPLTAEGRQRQANARSGQSNGPFNTMEDFSYYDRCITRGVTGSILPSLYGDAMRIVQSPT